MLTIRLQNVEELVFYNKALQQKLPEFKKLFYEWSLGKRISALNHLSQKAIGAFFDSVGEEHLQTMKEHFGVDVKIVRFDSHLVKNADFSQECASCEMNEASWYDNVLVWRDENRVYITSWR